MAAVTVCQFGKNEVAAVTVSQFGENEVAAVTVSQCEKNKIASVTVGNLQNGENGVAVIACHCMENRMISVTAC